MSSDFRPKRSSRAARPQDYITDLQPPPPAPKRQATVRPAPVSGQKRSSAAHVLVTVLPMEQRIHDGGAGSRNDGDTSTVECSAFPKGTRVWVKMTGYCLWPGVVWAFSDCHPAEKPDVVEQHVQGRCLVYFYGSAEYSWVPPGAVQLQHPTGFSPDSGDRGPTAAHKRPHTGDDKSAAHKRPHSGDRDDAVLDRQSSGFEKSAASRADCGAFEADEDIKEAGVTGGNMNATCGEKKHAARLDAMAAWGKKHSKQRVVAATLVELGISLAEPLLEVQRIIKQRRSRYFDTPTCGCCVEQGAQLRCSHCHCHVHALCLNPPALSEGHIPEGGWACPKCGKGSTEAVAVSARNPDESDLAGASAVAAEERLGLTPDWIIHAAAYDVFQLQRPSLSYPFIRGLLDPCSNNKASPNIPAEVLYDKRDDGLNPENSWAGFYVVLNPAYQAQIQWRFVNRAIDEVECGSVPAVILICRNSTDTAYYQRLTPYPRVLLKRSCARFKDYEKSPIGFGVVVFCVAKACSIALYQRFMAAFGGAGEANMPIDSEMVASPAFASLLTRLKSQAEQYQRDHWVQCSACTKWRIIPFAQSGGLQHGKEWTCSLLRPPHSSCATPQFKHERDGLPFTQAALADAQAREELHVAAQALASAGDNQPSRVQVAEAVASVIKQSPNTLSSDVTADAYETLFRQSSDTMVGTTGNVLQSMLPQKEGTCIVLGHQSAAVLLPRLLLAQQDPSTPMKARGDVAGGQHAGVVLDDQCTRTLMEVGGLGFEITAPSVGVDMSSGLPQDSVLSPATSTYFDVHSALNVASVALVADLRRKHMLAVQAHSEIMQALPASACPGRWSETRTQPGQVFLVQSFVKSNKSGTQMPSGETYMSTNSIHTNLSETIFLQAEGRILQHVSGHSQESGEDGNMVHKKECKPLHVTEQASNNQCSCSCGSARASSTSQHQARRTHPGESPELCFHLNAAPNDDITTAAVLAATTDLPSPTNLMDVDLGPCDSALAGTALCSTAIASHTQASASSAIPSKCATAPRVAPVAAPASSNPQSPTVATLAAPKSNPMQLDAIDPAASSAFSTPGVAATLATLEAPVPNPTPIERDKVESEGSTALLISTAAPPLPNPAPAELGMAATVEVVTVLTPREHEMLQSGDTATAVAPAQLELLQSAQSALVLALASAAAAAVVVETAAAAASAVEGIVEALRVASVAARLFANAVAAAAEAKRDASVAAAIAAADVAACIGYPEGISLPT